MRWPRTGRSPHGGNSHGTAGRIVVALAVVLAVAPFVVGLILDLTHGWLPAGDDAVIAERSWLVLTSHGPLLGQATLAHSGGHATYDLGPLLYWLLVLPTRLDPVHGVLWGAAFWSVVAALVAVAAGRAAAGPAGALIVGGIFTVLAVDLPQMVLDPVWNPSIGLCWYVAAAACGVAVATGRRRWLPALVVTASIAAQSHLSLAVGVFVAVPAAVAVGLAATPPASLRTWTRPIVAAVAVGVGCWAATLIQQVEGRPGNVSALLSASGRHPVFGWPVGMHAFGATVGLPPLWWYQIVGINRGGLFAIVRSGSLSAAAIVGLALVVVAVGAHRSGCHPLAALASVTVALGFGLVISVARFPTSEALALAYTLRPAYVIGLLAGVALASALVGVVVMVVRRRSGVGDVEYGGPTSRWGSPGRPDAVGKSSWVARTGVAVLAVGVLGVVVATASAESSQALVRQSESTSAQIRAITGAVDRVVPHGPAVLQIAPNPSLAAGKFDILAVDFGVIWLSHTDGRDLRLAIVAATNIGPEAGPAPGLPTVEVSFRRGRPVAVLVPGFGHRHR